MASLVLADDDEDLRDVYGCALAAAGHQILHARDGREALDMVRAKRPSLLLLDLWMPHLTGFDVLEALRHDPAGCFLRVIVVSNLADADSRLEAFEAGATEYLVKGRTLAEIVAVVERTLASDLIGFEAP